MPAPRLIFLRFGNYIASVDIQLPADLIAAAKLDQGSGVSLEAAKLKGFRRIFSRFENSTPSSSHSSASRSSSKPALSVNTP